MLGWKGRLNECLVVVDVIVIYGVELGCKKRGRIIERTAFRKGWQGARTRDFNARLSVLGIVAHVSTSSTSCKILKLPMGEVNQMHL